ncbi:MAG: pyridoxal phosphate-dependent aminotransferase, partial [Bacteroidetes bacterium]
METLSMDLEVNPRVASMLPSATLSMTARAKARIREGYPVISLSAGEPDFDTPAPIAEAAITAIREGFTHYTENRGMFALREAICEKLSGANGIDYTPDQILCSNGAKQSIAQVLSVLCGPGDEVLIPAPYWVSYPEQVRFAGGRPITISTTAGSEYRISPSELEAGITDKTRALILCSPSNPTGSVYSPEELRALANVLERYPEVYVISDEIYDQIIYDAQHLSFASIPEMKQRTVTVNGFSKSYAMTGWRLGYMAADSLIITQAAKLQSQFTSAPCSISQRAGIAALEMDRAPILEMVAAFRERRDFVLGALESRA